MKKTILGLAALRSTAVAGYAWAQEAAQPAAPAAEAQPAAPAQTESAPAAEPHAAAPEGSGGEAAGGHDGEIHLRAKAKPSITPCRAAREGLVLSPAPSAPMTRASFSAA
jgi:hypothetical protein